MNRSDRTQRGDKTFLGRHGGTREAMHALDFQESPGQNREGFQEPQSGRREKLCMTEISTEDFYDVSLHIKTLLCPLTLLKRWGKDMNCLHLCFSAWLLFLTCDFLQAKITR